MTAKWQYKEAYESALVANAELKAENAKLKEQVKTLFRIAKGNLVSAVNYERLLEAENDRLLELLQRTWDVFHNASGKEFDAVKQELRELGVEVLE